MLLFSRLRAVALVGLIVVANLGAEKKGAPGPARDGKASKKFNIPIPVGHEAKNLVIPLENSEGKLEMNFKMEMAKRIDADHLQMGNLKVEMFDEKGESAMLIDLPVSILDLNTRIITSKDPVTIRRSDFEITGETMEFNTETRLGRFVGKVRMLIYNRDELVPKGGAAE